jgi:hypothetical protein
MPTGVTPGFHEPAGHPSFISPRQYFYQGVMTFDFLPKNLTPMKTDFLSVLVTLTIFPLILGS